MDTVKVLALRSACVLAVTGALMAGPAAGQPRNGPDAPQARKPVPTQAAGKQAKPSAPKKAKAATTSTKPKKTAAVRKKPSKPVASRKQDPRKSSLASGRKSTPATAKASAQANRPPTRTAAATRRAAPLPPPVAWVPPPLGPERFYPNGIPELRPEFLHPEHPVRADPVVTSRPSSARQEWLP